MIQNQNFTALSLIGFGFVALLGCGKVGGTMAVTQSEATAPESASIDSFEGDWGKVDCQIGGTNKSDTTYVNSFAASTFTSTVVSYYTKNVTNHCSQVAYTSRYQWNYSLTPSLQVIGGFNLDSQLANVSVTPETPDVAAGFNSVAYFGRTNWLARQANVFLPPFDPSVSTQINDYDLILIQNNRLYWGDHSGEYDGLNSANRPIQIDWKNFDLKL